MVAGNELRGAASVTKKDHYRWGEVSKIKIKQEKRETVEEMIKQNKKKKRK